jgi:hypothetical protein
MNSQMLTYIIAFTYANAGDSVAIYTSPVNRSKFEKLFKYSFTRT